MSSDASTDAAVRGFNYVEQARQMADAKKDPDCAWLADAPSHILQHPLRDLEKACMTHVWVPKTSSTLVTAILIIGARMLVPTRILSAGL